MKKLLGLGMMALAFVGIGNTVQQSTVAANHQNNIRYDQRNQNRESQPIAPQQKLASKMKFESSRAYADMSYPNTGIDPKTYGMCCVRKGTHKRTNIC